MSRVCESCGKGISFGRQYCRRGLARAKGGAGQKVTGKTNRTFAPNLQKVRVCTESGAVRRMRVCTECIKKGRIRKAVGVGRRKAAPAGK
ncbi:MAG: 50S ribosomal protein L28 [Planctomycetota bacterium]